MWEVDETMSGIDDHTVMSNEVQIKNWSCQILHHDEMFRKNVIPNVKFGVAVAVGFSNWLFAT